MREEMDRAKMHKAIDASFSGLTGDPWLFQRVSARAAEGEIKVKKKISAGLVLALVLVLLAVAAVAVALLTHKEIMEQVAVPMALENDEETGGVNRCYSHEELARIVQVLEENGITLPENDSIMQHLQNGYGYYEDELANSICSAAFGGLYNTWTQEQKQWYEELEARMGHIETFLEYMPGEDNMTYPEAEAFALSRLREEYGQDLPLEDRNCWRMASSFYRKGENSKEDRWAFTLLPKDLDHGCYSIVFNDRNPAESAELQAQLPDWNRDYTGEELWDTFYSTYGPERYWPQAVWQKLHELMLKAKADPERRIDWIYTGFRLTSYPEPDAGEISREEAIRLAKEALGLERAAFDSAVLTEYEGERSWMVGFVIHDPPSRLLEVIDPESGWYVVSLDSGSGTVRSLKKLIRFEDSFYMVYIAEEAYDKAMEGRLRTKDLLPVAVEAIREGWPEAGDPLDEKEYAFVSHLDFEKALMFETRNPKHGSIRVYFHPDGTLNYVSVDNVPDGDSLFSWYQDACGSIEIWDQDIWVQLEKDMEELEPTEIEGKVLKATHYPEESSVSIGQKQARKLAEKAIGRRTAEAYTCVLVDALPHPVWIVQVSAVTPYSLTVIGIDAETGETVFTMPDRADFSPRYMSFSLPEIWRRVFPADMDWRTCTVGNGITWKEYLEMEDGTNWRLEVNGLTVRCISHREGVKSYEVEFDQEGNVIRFEEKD